MKRGFAVALLLVVALNSQINDATDENQVEIAQLCTIYKLLTAPLPEQKTQETAASSTDQAPHDTMSQVLNRALKLNLTIAVEPVDVVLKDTEKYKTKKDVDNDADKKGYFKLQTDDDLNKLRKLYGEVVGAEKANKEFSQTYKTPISAVHKATLRTPIAHLYKKLLEIHKKFSKDEQQLISDEKEARLKLIEAAGGEQLKTAAADTVTAISTGPEFTTETLPWEGTNDRDANCKEAGKTEKKAGMAVATDMLCICFAKKNGAHTFCQTSALTTTDHSSAKPASDVINDWHATVKLCKETPVGDTLAQRAHYILTAVADFKARLGKNMIKVGSVTDANNGAAKVGNFYGVYVYGAAAPVCDSSTTETSAAGHGVCIDYSAVRKPGKEIPWVAKATAAATDLIRLDHQRQKLENLVIAAQSVERQMEEVLLMKDLIDKTSPTAANQPNTKATTVNDNKCKPTNATPAE
uniref:Variant surface glycoprotein 1125.1170 n=1 Tax=Trypanosoma brucei TaxID=5691 RepID=A0A1J0R6N9_9TRYP|nr:variant surface glycoprotein 1125.1170 [Trypanosoma brucei]